MSTTEGVEKLSAAVNAMGITAGEAQKNLDKFLSNPAVKKAIGEIAAMSAKEVAKRNLK